MKHTEEESKARDEAVRAVCELIGKLGDELDLCPMCFIVEVMSAASMFVTVDIPKAPALANIDEVLRYVKEDCEARMAGGTGTIH